MNTAATILLTVAKELAEQAKNGLPKMREGEEVQREWYEPGKYYRETTLNGERHICLFDFRQKESRLTAASVTE
jgi:hypothetical protein